jgi:tRNA pseudouridine(38-40) synthase
MGPKVKLILSYDGTCFSGWQKQKQSLKPTVQGTLEGLVSRLFNQEVRVIGASRTDSGVHAWAQVAHFKAPTSLEKHNLFKSLTAMPWLRRQAKLIAILFLTRRSKTPSFEREPYGFKSL